VENDKSKKSQQKVRKEDEEALPPLPENFPQAPTTAIHLPDIYRQFT